MMTDEIVNRVMRLVMQGLAEHEDQDLTDRVSLESFTSTLRERLNDYVILARKDAHLSQPQPVAQGEAVVRDAALECARRCYGYWKGAEEMDYFDKHLTSPGIAYTIDMVEGILRNKLLATPTIPTGHRVVPDDLLTVALEANDMCRSAFQVAERVATQYSTVYAGTNFGALHEQLKKSLDRQHQVLKPYREAELAASPSAGGV
jgi:hypothetical protein